MELTLPPVRKRKDYSDIGKDDLVMALFHEQIAPTGSMREENEQIEGKAMDAIKAGARHSRNDTALLQTIHDNAVACGASCGADDDEDESEADDDLDMEAEKAIKSIQDNPQWYASHECGDVAQAAGALSTLSMLIQSELAEQDEDDEQIGMLCDAARILVRFIGGELDELQGAASETPDSAKAYDFLDDDYTIKQTAEDRAMFANMGSSGGGKGGGKPSGGQGGLYKENADGERTPQAGHEVAPKAAKLSPKAKREIAKLEAQRKYIMDAPHRANDPMHQATLKRIKARLSELHGGATKGIELAHLDTGEDVAIMDGSAIKAITTTPGLVGGYLVKFGGDGDLSNFRDVFTPHTNYGKHTKSDVWVHHRMLPGLGKKQLANQAEIGMDDEGVFVKHLLDLRDSYEAKLYGLVQAGKLGWSSGTAPHLVERKALGDGRHEITQWTLGLDASYTPMPAGGLLVNAGAMKSLLDEAGIDLISALYIDEDQKPDAVKAIELELIAIEAEYAAIADMAV